MHYEQAFLGELNAQFAAWELGSAPSPRLRYLIGRMYEEFGSTQGGSYLSQARIRDRGFDFVKTEEGGEFYITRHLNAWSDDRLMTRVVERWKFNLNKQVFTFIDSRNWGEGDPD
jgi:hypothetical protein